MSRNGRKAPIVTLPLEKQDVSERRLRAGDRPALPHLLAGAGADMARLARVGFSARRNVREEKRRSRVEMIIAGRSGDGVSVTAH